MACHVDHIVDTAHHPKVALLVHDTGIAGQVVAFKARQVRVVVSLFVPPERRQCSRRQGKLYHDVSRFAHGNLIPFVVKYPDVISRYCNGGRTRFNRKSFYAHWICRHCPSTFRLPPMIYDRNFKLFLSPVQGIRIAPLTRQEQRLKAADVVLTQ